MNNITQQIQNMIFGGNPYDGFTTIDYDLHGHDQGYDRAFFADILDRSKPKTILEIGSWKGRSAVEMARVAPNAEIVCVDTWLGAIEFIKPPGDSSRCLDRINGWPMVYYTFLSNMIHEGLSDRVTPFPMTSTLAMRQFRNNGFKFDFIYIDGSHETDDVARDIIEAKQIINPNGTICGDDINWPSIQEALIGENYRELHTVKWELIN